MKKIVVAVVIPIAIIAAFFLGRINGMRHAIMDASVWSDAGAYYLELDGEVYSYSYY